MIKNDWKDGEIVIDGKLEDWQKVKQGYIEEIKTAFATVNDDKNMFVMIRFTDPKLADRILKRGISLWLDKEDGKNKDYGIRYAGSTEIFNAAVMQKRSASSFPVVKKDFTLPKKDMIQVFVDGNMIDEAANKESGFAAASVKDGFSYSYEFRIPLQKSQNLSDKVDFCLEIGGLGEDELAKMRNKRPRDKRGKSGGGDFTGMKKGGGQKGRKSFRGSKNGGVENLAAKEIWIEMSFAEKKL